MRDCPNAESLGFLAPDASPSTDKVGQTGKDGERGGNEFLVISDQRCPRRAEYLRHVVAPHCDPKVGCVTCFEYLSTMLVRATSQSIGMYRTSILEVSCSAVDESSSPWGRPLLQNSSHLLDWGYERLKTSLPRLFLVAALIAQQGLKSK